MRTRMWGLITGIGAAAALAVAAIAAPVAQAASHIVHTGRGGVFVLTTPGPASAATILAGAAIAAAVVAAVVFIALRLDRSGRARLQTVPALQEPGSVDAPAEGAGRKAA